MPSKRWAVISRRRFWPRFMLCTLPNDEKIFVGRSESWFVPRFMNCTLPNDEKISVGSSESWLAYRLICSSAPLFENSPLGSVARLLRLRSSICKLDSRAKTSAGSEEIFEFVKDSDVVFPQHPAHETVAVTSQQVGAELHASTDKDSHPASNSNHKEARRITGRQHSRLSTRKC